MKAYRLGFFLDEFIENDFKCVFDKRKACKNVEKTIKFMEEFMEELKEFLKENGDNK